jgi:uncharacterized protein (DUF3084 family)
MATDGRNARALADLEHKPWAAEDGQLWQATFACELDGAEALEAELNVAPDITISLPAPGGVAGTGAKRAKRERSVRESIARRDRLERQPQPRHSSARPTQESTARREISRLKTALDETTAERDRQRDEANAELKQVRDQANADTERLRNELLAAESKQAELTARIEELTTALNRAVTARKSAIAARDQALAASERSVSERDAAVKAHNKAVAARNAAIESRDTAIAMREQALNSRDESDAAANAALLARNQALAERDAAQMARDEAVAERRTLAQTADRLRTQREDEVTTRGAQLVMRNATIASGAARHHADWIQRTIAILVVLCVLLALLIVTRLL